SKVRWEIGSKGPDGRPAGASLLPASLDTSTSGSSPRNATMAVVSPISIGVSAASIVSLKIEPERNAFIGRQPGADRLHRLHHAALPPENLVGERDQPHVRNRGRRGIADTFCDHRFVALRIQRAGGDEGAGGGAADAGI